MRSRVVNWPRVGVLVMVVAGIVLTVIGFREMNPLATFAGGVWLTLATCFGAMESGEW